MNRHIYLWFLTLAFSFTVNENMTAQNNVQVKKEKQQRDSTKHVERAWVEGIDRDELIRKINSTIVLEYGNLYGLTQNIHKSFLLYNHPKGSIISINQHPIVVRNDKFLTIIGPDEQKTTSIDNVESIEVTYDPKNTVLFGARALECVVIKVKLKDESEK